MSERVPCPIVECEGEVLSRKFGEFKAFGCTGDGLHTHSQIVNAFLREDEKWFAQNREDMWAIERRVDPVGWLHDRLDEARDAPDEKFNDEDPEVVQSLPGYSAGFTNRTTTRLTELRGMTTLSGKASSGKSWFALGVAVESAREGWDVHYLAAEAPDVIGRRMTAACGGSMPSRFHLHSVEPGVTASDMIDEIREWVVSTRTLLVIDSISTLLGLMRFSGQGDRWEAQDRLEMFLMRVRALTKGEIGILVISEANAQGESKGRVIDHRSDLSINFSSVEDSDSKEVIVKKAWEAATGLVGRADVDPLGPGLALRYDGPNAYNTTKEGAF